ncbi:hypothetical protein [Alloactinosynnema sp. L-07]|uniref:NHL repeat-containing protein n=1 Tax=Alloactinosynnema sp. L-07 TaxID=1653480 RepID=UPI00065EF1CC|nr:NHL repeat-containing protein [Alloactinosynnema sp. L-07]CRK56526.1 hypothetical protein [Alloactinosynnema sp. L-07]
MTMIVFAEFLGGRVLAVKDLDGATVQQIGGTALASPSGLAVDPSGTVVAAELDAHAVSLAKAGAAWTRFGTHGSGVNEFARPAAAAFRDGSIIVLDSGNHRLVQLSDIDGTGWTTYGHRGRPTADDPAEGAFADPRGVAVDELGRIWVSDPGNSRVIRVDAIDGTGWVEIPLPAGTVPYGISAHGSGVHVVDSGNQQIITVDADGAVTNLIGLADGTWVSPAFVTATGDDVVIADVVANELRSLAADGTVTAALRGSPPDQLDPLFDSIGGVAA